MIREYLGLIACYESLTEVGAAILNGKIMPLISNGCCGEAVLISKLCLVLDQRNMSSVARLLLYQRGISHNAHLDGIVGGGEISVTADW